METNSQKSYQPNLIRFVVPYEYSKINKLLKSLTAEEENKLRQGIFNGDKLIILQIHL